MKLNTRFFANNLSLIAFVFFLALMVGCTKKEGDGELKPEPEPEEINELLSGTITEPLILKNRFTDPNVVDYKVETSFTVSSMLTIMPGVRIEMDANAKINITEQGTIISLGTADSNIVITGKNPSPGYWDYILINSFDYQNRFSHTVIEYGGGNINQPGALVLVGNASLIKLDNSVIRHSDRNGIYVTSTHSRILDFNNNRIENCGLAPLSIKGGQISGMNTTNILSNNGLNYIEVNGGSVFSVETWPKLDIPFYMKSVTEINADVIIEPGARFLFAPSGRLLVRETGSMYAVASPTDSIYFWGNQSINGYWDCITFLSNSPYNEFRYVSVKDGGGYYLWNANVYLYDAFLKVSYSTIANSQRWGIYRNGVSNFENGGFNNFYNNTSGNIGP